MSTPTSRHGRGESVAFGGSSWLPPFVSSVQALLAEPVQPVAPLSFVPVDWVQTTFPHIEPVKGGKLESYIKQLRRTVKDLARTREVQGDQSAAHSLVLHALEGMVEAYLGLNESVREMCKYVADEMKEQEKDDRIFEQRQAKIDGTAAGGHARVPSVPRLAASSSSAPSTGGRPTINVDEPTNATNTTGGSSVDSSTPLSTLSSDSMEPYSPKIAHDTPAQTPVPSPHRPRVGGDLNTTSLAALSLAAAAPPLDPNSTEGKRAIRTKRMAELRQDHSSLLSVKRHCVKTLRALRNVHVLVSAVDVLKDILADREFQSARLAFQAITEIFGTLQPYSKLPILRALNEHVESYKSQLRKEIFNAFREHVGSTFMGGAMGPGGPPTPAARLAGLGRLHHCCRLIDLLYSSFERKELVKWWVVVQQVGYTQLVSRRAFGDLTNPKVVAGKLTGFEHLEKQLAWVSSELREMWTKEWAPVFPSAWYVDALFVRKFFETVRAQIALTLEAQEKLVKEENETTRRALHEAKKARALQAEINKIHHSGGNTSSGGSHGPNGAAQPNGGGAPSSKPKLATGDSFTSTASGDIEGDDEPLVFDFYKPLLLTIEFENAMRLRWLNDQSEASLQEEDLFVVLGTVTNPALGQDPSSPPSPLSRNPPPFPFQFAGYLSSAFRPYLGHMLLSERTRFYNFLQGLDEEEQWEVESAEISTCHFSAATSLFVMIQKSMERYSKVLPADLFLDLFKEYRTSISNYLELLSKHLPAAATLAEEEVQSICATINTSDYILDRCNSLAATVVQMISGQAPDSTDDDLNDEQLSYLQVLREQCDLSAVEEQVSHLNHRATHALASNIVRRLEPSLARMRGGAGNGAAAVSDENKYVREIVQTLKAQLGDKAKMSSFAYLAQVVAQEFLRAYFTSLRACKFKITEGVAQQMLLDLQALKTFLIQGLPEMKVRAARASVMVKPGANLEEAAGDSSSNGPAPTPAAFKAYCKMVAAQTVNSENLLKVLTSPTPRLLQNYKIIFPKASVEQIVEMLGLRGLSASEQEKLVAAYNATIKNPAEHILLPKKSTFFSQLGRVLQ